jgi:4-hydroxybenzoate polyprenyltransferase
MMRLYGLFLITRPLNLFFLICIYWFLAKVSNLGFNFHNLAFFASIILTTAAGYAINDHFDIQSDVLNNKNRPISKYRLTLKNVVLFYSFLNFFAILLSYLSVDIYFAFIVLLVQLSLLLYARYFKRIALIGNILVALLSSLSILLIVKIIPEVNSEFQTFLLHFSIFIFVYTFTRELFKTIEDTQGDKASNMKTISCLLGIKLSMYASGGALIGFGIGMLLFEYLFSIQYIYSSYVFALGNILLLALGFWAIAKPNTKTASRIAKFMKLMMAMFVFVLWLLYSLGS